MSVLQKVKVNDVDIPEGVTKYDLYKVRDVRCAQGFFLSVLLLGDCACYASRCTCLIGRARFSPRD